MASAWVIIAAAALIGGVGLHLWWRGRWRVLVRAQAENLRRIAELEERERRIARQARAQQRALFDSMFEGVLVLDAQGRIQLANRALQELMSAADELPGLTIMEAFRSHELAGLVKRAGQEGQVFGFELEIAGDTRRWLQVNAASIVDEEKRLQGVILVFHDLTRVKQLENTRQEFVANVSHELRTPLSLIKGYVETLIDGAKDDPDVAPRFLETILKHSDRLTFLIEDLLTISQLESGRSVFNFQRVDLRPNVERVLDDLRERAAEKKVELGNAVAENLFIRADTNRLQQVLMNLVENAIKYGRSEGAVEVAARVLDEGMIEVSVRDNGPGIPQDSIERVFERFYRVDRARSREQGGTGLGLSIVKHIVQAHGGEVWARSDLGRGTTMFFTLPAA